MKLYGIPNCDTVKKARAWLASYAIGVEFHDFKKHGVSAEKTAVVGNCGFDRVNSAL